MRAGIAREIRQGETRVAATPDSARKLIKKGLQVVVEKGAGTAAGFPDESYTQAGAQVADGSTVLGCEIVLKIHKPAAEEILKMKKGALLIAMLEPYLSDGTFEKLAEMGVNAMALELVPRTSRAQSMDVLSSQAGIAGYRAVIEAAARFGRFFPIMMTSAGSSKPAKVVVLGAGVAGLQAIATAKRLGGTIEAFDVRPEVKEQILSLGAKFIELDLGETATGAGGYAKELSEEGKRRQQQQLGERIKKADVVITTANVPGRKAPVLVTEEMVRGMRAGSVIIDMAAASGGNCPLTEADRVVIKNGVIVVGFTNYPAMVPADSSSFFANNVVSLLSLAVGETGAAINLNMSDDIIAAALVTHQGAICPRR